MRLWDSCSWFLCWAQTKTPRGYKKNIAYRSVVSDLSATSTKRRYTAGVLPTHTKKSEVPNKVVYTCTKRDASRVCGARGPARRKQPTAQRARARYNSHPSPLNTWLAEGSNARGAIAHVPKPRIHHQPRPSTLPRSSQQAAVLLASRPNLAHALPSF